VHRVLLPITGHQRGIPNKLDVFSSVKCCLVVEVESGETNSIVDDGKHQQRDDTGSYKNACGVKAPAYKLDMWLESAAFSGRQAVYSSFGGEDKKNALEWWVRNSNFNKHR